MIAEIDMRGVNSLDAMFAAFDKAFGFPDFFGNNLSALVDCLFCSVCPKTKLTKLVLKEEREHILLITGAQVFSEQHPNLLAYLFTAICFVNNKYESISVRTRFAIRPSH